MSNELQVAEAYNIVVTPEQKELVKKTVFPDATDAELQLFFFDCTRRGIHPLDKLIHPTKRNGKYTPITSIDLFRQRASESGEHMGTQDAVYTGEPGKPEFAASVTVYKHLRGEKCPFTATARWSEYFPGEKQGFMWQKMPHLMLAKCAEALALRKAFPQQLHGLYTHEEMAQAEPSRPTVNIPQTRPQVGNRDMSPIPQEGSIEDARGVPDDYYKRTVLKPAERLVKHATDRYTGERQEDGAVTVPVKEQANPAVEPTAQQYSDAPASPLSEPLLGRLTAAEFARQKANEIQDLYVDGYIGKLQKYNGKRAFEKGCKPGMFDVEDASGHVLLAGIKYFDPAVSLTSGLKRVSYLIEYYKGKEQFNLTSIKDVE